MGRSKHRKPKHAKPEAEPAQMQAFLDMTQMEVTELLERIDTVNPPRDAAAVRGMAAKVRCLEEELRRKGTSIQRLRELAFGAPTETTRNLFPDKAKAQGKAKEPKPPKPGHGPKGSTAFPMALRVKVPHATLKAGDCCPECPNGRLYPKGQPAVMVRIVGMAPLRAKVIEREVLRCNDAESPLRLLILRRPVLNRNMMRRFRPWHPCFGSEPECPTAAFLVFC